MNKCSQLCVADDLELISAASYSAWKAADRTDTELARIARNATDELLRKSGRPCHAAFLASIKPMRSGGEAA